MSKKPTSDLKEVKNAFVTGKKKEKALDRYYKEVSKHFKAEEEAQAKAQKKFRNLRLRACY
ncbi:MAG: hypothetical protein ISR98_01970 [Parcubacteria group bacterium]|nr:hypothetical protein [Parcubacteria group bacterium]